MNPGIDHPRLHPIPIGPKFAFRPASMGADDISQTRPAHMKHGREAERRFWEAWDCAVDDPRGGQCKSKLAQVL